MIRHIVFWKFRPDADPEPFLQALSALPEQIDWIRGMHVARSAAPNAAWDAALEVDFDTLEDVARYRDDPRHKKVSALCKSIRTDRVSIDIPLGAGGGSTSCAAVTARSTPA